MTDRTWTDNNGASRYVPTTMWRLDFGKPSHAAIRKFVMKRDGFTCQVCGNKPDSTPQFYDGSYAPELKSGRYLVVDHVVAAKLGHPGHNHHPNNLQVLCDPCNKAKGVLVDRLNYEVAR